MAIVRPPPARKQRGSPTRLALLLAAVMVMALLWYRGSLDQPQSQVLLVGGRQVTAATATGATALPQPAAAATAGAAASSTGQAAAQPEPASSAAAPAAADASGAVNPVLPGIHPGRVSNFKTGFFYTFKKDEAAPEERFELLDEPVPESCHMEAMADYDGPSLTWGLHNKAQSARQCCEACQKHAGGEHRCDIWVYCGSKTGDCWSPDIWNHTTGECWLKYQTEWDGSYDLSSTNLKVNARGRYAPEYRKEHKTAPLAVEWTAGLIPPS